MGKKLFKRKLTWLFLMIILVLLYMQLLLFFRPQVVLENKTDHLIYIYFRQSPILPDLDNEDPSIEKGVYVLKPHKKRVIRASKKAMTEDEIFLTMGLRFKNKEGSSSMIDAFSFEANRSVGACRILIKITENSTQREELPYVYCAKKFK